ncbi:hypothetical protein PSSHI_47950 [Photobacterium sp. R1]
MFIPFLVSYEYSLRIDAYGGEMNKLTKIHLITLFLMLSLSSEAKDESCAGIGEWIGLCDAVRQAGREAAEEVLMLPI